MRRSIASLFIAALITLSSLKSACAEEITRHVLNNGVTVLIKESHKVPLVAIEAQIKVGSATEKDYLGSGISHFVEHMLFKGTKKRPKPGDIQKEIKLLGGYTNAFTSRDLTGFKIIVPTGAENYALEILKDILTEPLLDPGELEKEREVILKEIRLVRDEPANYLSLLLWSNMFKVHSYRFSIIGYENLFQKLKRPDLLKHFQTHYIPDNIVLGIAGDVDAKKVLKEVEKTFGQIERVYPTQFYSQKEPTQITEITVEEERDLSLAYCSMGFHSVSVRNEDLFSLDVLSMILGGGEDSRLFRRLYRQRKLVYSTGSFNYTPKDPGIFAVTAVLEPENIDKAIEEIWDQIELLKKQQVADRELEKAKNNVLSAYIFSRQTIEAEVSDMASGELIAGDYDFTKKYVEGIKSVTRESVRNAANKYLSRQNMTLVKLLPKIQPAPSLTTQKAGSAPVYNIEMLTLKNNLRVLLCEDHTLPIIAINAVGMGGARAENFKNNGISNLVARALLGGTRQMREEEIFSRIEGCGATLSSFSGNNAFGLSATGLTKDSDLILGIFADVLQNPSFYQEIIDREKASILGDIKSINENIYQSGLRTLKYILFKSHPYRFNILGTPSSLKNISQEQILDYYDKYYRQANMVLVVSGDIDKVDIKRKVKNLFEKFKETPEVKIRLPKETKKTRPRTVSREIEKEQSLVLLGYLGTSIKNDDKYALEVMISIFSGMEGRLYKNIREKRGLSYTLGAGSIIGIEPGIIVFYVGTTRENLETVKSELFREIELLKQGGIEDEELTSSKNQLIAFHKNGLQRVQDVAMRAALDELYGLGYNNFLRYEDKIADVSKEDVLRVAQKYLNPNSYMLVIIKGSN